MKFFLNLRAQQQKVVGYFSFNFKPFLVLVLFLILTLPLASAIGASPPSRSVDYENGFDKTFSFRIINNNIDPNKFVKLTLSGNLAPYATLEENNFSFSGSEIHTVRVRLVLPSYEEIGVYGKQYLRIKATEKIEKKGMFSVGTAVGVWIQVYIPVPGDFGEIDSFAVENVLEGYDSDFKLVLANRGTQDLSDAFANIIIKDFSGNQIDNLSFKNLNISIDDKLTIDDIIPSSNYDSGKYFAKAEFYFNSDFVPDVISKTFFVGSSDIFIENYTKTLIEGKINKINITSQSLWGSPLNDVKFGLFYSGSLRSLPTRDYNSFQKQTFEAFIETPLINDKKTDSIDFNADLKISIPLDDKVITKSVPLNFIVLKEKSSFSLSTTTLLIIGGVLLFIIIVLVNIFIIFKIKKKK